MKIIHVLLLSVFWGQICLAADDQSDFLRDAQNYLAKGEPRAALIQLKNFVRESPYDPQGRVLLGTTYMQLGDIPSALTQLEKARDLDADVQGWTVPLAKAYLASGQPRKVIDEIGTPSGLDQEARANVLALVGAAHLMLNETDQASEQFARALELDRYSEGALLGKARIAFQADDKKTASSLATGVLDRNPESVEAWLILGELERVSANYSAALEIYDRVLGINEASLPAYLGRATIYLMTGELDRAESDIATVRKTAGEIPMVLYLNGALLFERKSYKESATTLKQLLNAVPDHMPSHLLLGTIAYFQGEYESAYVYLSRYVKEVPSHLAASKLLAATSLKLDHVKEAVNVLEAVEGVGQNDPQFLALLGTAYLQDKQFVKGTEILDRAVTLAPDVAAIRAQLAIGHLASGRTDEAVGELNDAVDLGQDLIQADIMLVLALIQQKKFDEAIEKGQKLAEKLPENPVAANLLGASYLAKGETDLARKSWMRALEIQPDFTTATMNLAKLDAKLGNFDAARQWYQTILKQEPENLAAMMGLAQLAEFEKDQEAMVGWLQKAARNHPDKVEPGLVLARAYLSGGNTDAASKVISPLAEKFPENPGVLRTQGLIQLAKAENVSAISIFYELLQVDGTNPEYHHLLAQALLRGGEPDKARQQWEKAVALKADYLPAEASLARLAMEKKEYQEALRLAGEIRSRHPKSSVGFQLEGDAEFRLKNYGKASQAYSRAFEIKPSSALAQGLFNSSRQAGNKEKAYAGMEKWLVEHPGDLGSNILLAMGYQEEGQRDKAISAYENARKIKGNNVVVLNNLAWLYQESGDERAVETAEAALSAANENPEVTDTVGWILMQNGQESRSVVLLQQAALSAPHMPAIRVHLAEAFVRAGRIDEARAELERVLSEHDEFPERSQATDMLDKL